MTGEKSKGKILVIDDDDAVRHVITMILLKAGYEVVSARDGSDGIKIFEENMNAIPLALVDITLPDMDGLEASRRLKTFNSNLKIIIVSGHSLENAKAQYSDVENYGFLEKPFTVATLTSRVNSFL